VLLRADLRSWWGILREAFEQVKAINDPDKLVKVQELLATLHIILGEPGSARAYMHELHEKAESDLYQMLRVFALLMQIETLTTTSFFSAQFEQRVTEMLKEIEVEESLEAELYQALAFASTHHGNFSDGLKYGSIAYERHRELLMPNRHEMARTALSIGESYRALKRYDEALRYYDLAQSHVNAYDVKSYRINGLIRNARGLCYFNTEKVENFPKALIELTDALAYFQKFGERYYIAFGRHSLALVQAWTGQYAAAEEHLHAALDYWRGIQKLYTQAEALYTLGYIAHKRHQRETALHWLEQARQVCNVANQQPAIPYLRWLIEALITSIHEENTPPAE
jgi:tetratricopeptide (TPR) repeat protein